MKINQEMRTTVEKGRQEIKPASGSSVKFQELVQRVDEKMQTTEMNKLLSQIEDAGKRLARSRTIQDLIKYKGLVKKFIQQTVDYGMNLKQSNSFNEYGNARQLQIIEEVDSHLTTMTDEVMGKEKASIDLLGHIGEVKGLLINLYT